MLKFRPPHKKKKIAHSRQKYDKEKIKEIVYKFIHKENYSDKLWNLVFKMIEPDEDKRYDFIELYNYLKNLDISK